jgi:hypothetical protein
MTYTDYDEQVRTEDFYFSLSKAELMEMELGTTGGMSKFIDKIVNTNDTPKLMEIFKDIIARSYGEKSPDGKYFEKVRDGHRLVDKFIQTEAYSDLFMELATNDKSAVAFINGIIPQTFAAEMAEQSRKQGIAAVTQ